MANKANLGHLIGSESQKEGVNSSEINSKPLIPKKLFK